MKIIFAITSLGGGGAEKVLAWLANSCARARHQVIVITLTNVDADRQVLQSDVTRVTLEGESSSSAIKRNVSWIRQMREAIRSAQPDVVVSFLDQVNLLVLLGTRGLGVPVIVSERVDPRSGELRPIFRPLRLALYHGADAVVVQTPEVKQWFARRGLGGRAHVIPNPAIWATVHTRHRARRVISVGRLAPQKGHDLLIRAFATVAREFPDWELVIYGEGAERRRLQQLIVTSRLEERARLAGRVDRPEHALAEAQIFVLSSRYEGFPNALLEAMGHGLAVASFDCESGPRTLIRHGVDGLLVRPLDVQALSRAMRTLMSDTNLRNSLAARAVGIRDRFSEADVLEQWSTLLTRVVRRRQKRMGL